MSASWGRYKYEYECIDQKDEVVATGEFIIELPCTIRSSLILTQGILEVYEHDQERLYWYRGENHLKDIRLNVTNVHTKSVREFSKDRDSTAQALKIKKKAVDVKPIIYAHWEDMYGGKYANPRYVCSACKGKALWKSVQDELLSWHEVQALTPYCPHCGAEMDIKEG